MKNVLKNGLIWGLLTAVASAGGFLILLLGTTPVKGIISSPVGRSWGYIILYFAGLTLFLILKFGKEGYDFEKSAEKNAWLHLVGYALVGNLAFMLVNIIVNYANPTITIVQFMAELLIGKMGLSYKTLVAEYRGAMLSALLIHTVYCVIITLGSCYLGMRKRRREKTRFEAEQVLKNSQQKM